MLKLSQTIVTQSSFLNGFVHTLIVKMVSIKCFMLNIGYWLQLYINTVPICCKLVLVYTVLPYAYTIFYLVWLKLLLLIINQKFCVRTKRHCDQVAQVQIFIFLCKTTTHQIETGLVEHIHQENAFKFLPSTVQNT